MWTTTTTIGHTGHWVSCLRSPSNRHQRSAIPSLPRCNAPTPPSVRSTNTDWLPDLGGWDSRHPQDPATRPRIRLQDPAQIRSAGNGAVRLWPYLLAGRRLDPWMFHAILPMRWAHRVTLDPERPAG